MSKAAKMLEDFGIDYEMNVISAHREPDVFVEYAKTAKDRGIDVIIAGAGGAAHLPGMCAAIFPLPVIGVPIHTKSLGGVDHLCSIVQMPSGIPVATVAINGAANAAILRRQRCYQSQILRCRMNWLLIKKSLKDEVGLAAKMKKLSSLGYAAYLEQM